MKKILNKIPMLVERAEKLAENKSIWNKHQFFLEFNKIFNRNVCLSGRQLNRLLNSCKKYQVIKSNDVFEFKKR